MSVPLTGLQKKLCNILQQGLPVASRPFAGIAEIIGSSEKEILRQVRQLRKKRVIRRLAAVINYRSLGKVSTLVTAHVPEDDVMEVGEAVNSLAGVSHNYLRKHRYNLWFTLQGRSQAEIETTLLKLSSRFGVDFHSLPVTHVFKLDVRFDAENIERFTADAVQAARIPKTKKVLLSERQKIILAGLQSELKIVERPFEFLCSEKLTEKNVLEIINSLIAKGVISRLAAIVDHRKLGFVANVMFVCCVPDERIVEAGRTLACFGAVSHCYARKTFEGWPYNLFGMMHGLSMGDIQRTIDEFTESEKIDTFELLPTETELKKRPVEHKL